MAVPVLIAPVLTWIFREIIIKAVIFLGLFALVQFLVPVAVEYLGTAVTGSDLTSALSVVSPGVWWVLDAFNVTVGLPMLISAYISRFLIRRLPVIG